MKKYLLLFVLLGGTCFADTDPFHVQSINWGSQGIWTFDADLSTSDMDHFRDLGGTDNTVTVPGGFRPDGSQLVFDESTGLIDYEDEIGDILFTGTPTPFSSSGGSSGGGTVFDPSALQVATKPVDAADDSAVDWTANTSLLGEAKESRLLLTEIKIGVMWLCGLVLVSLSVHAFKV